MNDLPHCETLLLNLENGVLHVTLNRPDSRNAMSLAMVGELRATLEAVRHEPEVRALVLRGADGHFCAGGDIKDMAGARARGGDAYRELNRAFGALLEEAQAAPQVLVAVLEGAVLGGGFGLACVSDVAIAASDARFGLPETTLGILPAQIAPFVVHRIGLTQARRLALTAARVDGAEALRLGLVHHCEADAAALQQRLQDTLAQIRQCAPQA
ncbi:MAG: enoyl-CoA hydratase/isomerase family protein, partial [Pseudomonadales bacterium]